MSMKMMNAAYLVDNAALLSLQEKQDGVEFHCFDMDSKVQIAEGHIGWDVLDKQPFSTLEESARMAALQQILRLDGLAVAPVAPEMLEQVRGGRKVLWQMKKADPELENAKNIRFITSSYEDRFKIPDGSAVEIEYPNRKFSARCAWDLGSKGFLAIQTCEDGYDYTLYHKDFTEIDGGQIDDPEISMNAARDQILSDYGFGGRTMTRIDYDELCDRAEEAEISRRESVLGKLSDLSSRTDTPVKAAKAKEAER